MKKCSKSVRLMVPDQYNVSIKQFQILIASYVYIVNFFFLVGFTSYQYRQDSVAFSHERIKNPLQDSNPQWQIIKLQCWHYIVPNILPSTNSVEIIPWTYNWICSSQEQSYHGMFYTWYTSPSLKDIAFPFLYFSIYREMWKKPW